MDRTGQEADPELAELLPWQQKALSLWVEGCLQKQIAEDVGKSVRTINRFLRSESACRLSQKLREVQWDRLTVECANSVVPLFDRVRHLERVCGKSSAIEAD